MKVTSDTEADLNRFEDDYLWTDEVREIPINKPRIIEHTVAPEPGIGEIVLSAIYIVFVAITGTIMLALHLFIFWVVPLVFSAWIVLKVAHWMGLY